MKNGGTTGDVAVDDALQTYTLMVSGVTIAINDLNIIEAEYYPLFNEIFKKLQNDRLSKSMKKNRGR